MKAPMAMARLLLAFFLFASVACKQAVAGPARIKDISRVQGQRTHSLVGYGIVTGLAGTGDSAASRATRQSVANTMAQFNLSVPPESVASRNVAVVIVSASLPAFAKPGDSVDVTVTSLGDARSLAGGNLLLTPLKGPDGRGYCLAQGAVTVGGYKYAANGNVNQKNHPTAAIIPGGAIVEVSPPIAASAQEGAQAFMISLLDADYTTASRVADAINGELGAGQARAVDAQAIQVQVPQEYRGRTVDLIRRIESIEVQTDLRARVIFNERTGTVVAGANVRLEPVAISYGDLRVSVVSDTQVSQPNVVMGYQPGLASVPYTNTRIDVREGAAGAVLTTPHGTVSDLVQALARLKTNTQDVGSILKALKAAGALHAELIVQ